MERKGLQKMKLAWGMIALMLVCVCVIGGILLWHSAQEAQLETQQQEALEMLDARAGEYNAQKIVLPDTTHAEAKALAQELGATLRITQDGGFAVLTLPEGTTIRDVYALDEYKGYIEDMSPDFYAQAAELTTARPQYAVSDDGYERQGYLDYLNIGNAWDWTLGSGVTVAIIDTGIDTDHPEFAGRISEYSYNATEDKIVKDYNDWSLIEDEQGHGTAVAGVIAAAMDGSGTVGIAPNVNILVIKVECDADGMFYSSSDLVFGLYYAIERDAQVVNMSFGSSQNLFADAAALAVDSDIICVAAAGNDATSALTYPAADENVIGVGALAADSWELAEYSNYGENTNLVAPGTTYTSLMGGTYGDMTGTSLACPTVVGGIALYLSRNHYATIDTVTEHLYAACCDLGDLGPDWYYGYGALDISALVVEAKGTVTFQMLTDELENLEQVFVRQHTLQNIPEPERLYAVFDGWYYDIDCTEPLNLYADTFSADLTLYAKWVNEDDGVPYTYVELADGTIEIRSYTGKRRYITVPEYIDGKAVSSIGADAFAGNTRLREVTLPAQLKRIGDRAFRGCSNLTVVEIPDSVTRIGEYAFQDNVRLNAVSFGANSCLDTIGDGAFQNCGNLLRFEIPGSVTSLDGSAFFGATGIRQFGILGQSNSFAVVDGVLLNLPGTTVVAYPAGKAGEYTLPDSVNYIGSCAFAYSRLGSMDLKNVSALGDYAFAFSSLQAVTLPDSVTAIGENAFAYCGYLRQVELSANMTTIPGKAFAACSALEQITIPAGIVTIQQDAFVNAASLHILRFEAGSRLTSIGARAFAKSGLQEVTFPASLVSIGEAAFSENYQLQAVRFDAGSSLSVIGKAAFKQAVALTVLELPESLAAIGDFAFLEIGLTEVTLPASLRELGIGVFGGCHSLENIYVHSGNAYYTAVNGVVYSTDKTQILAYPAGNERSSYAIENTVTTIGKGAFYGAWNLNSVTLPKTLHTVDVYGFYDCKNIADYSLPDSLTAIEEYAFSKNSSLSYIAIPDNVVQIGRYAFSEDYALTEIYFNDSAKLSRIGYAAFAYTGIYSFRVPANVSSMAQYAFQGCDELQSITFAAGSKLESISAYLFQGNNRLYSITFENGSALTSIQAHGFEGVTNLTYVDFGDAKLTNIDNYAFRYCQYLENLTIPDTVTNIGRYAFSGCQFLQQLHIPAAVAHIGENAFYGTENLDVYFAADTLPAYLDANWDNSIRGYYVGVQSVEENDDWRYAVLHSGSISIVEYLGSDTAIDLTALNLGGDIVSIGGNAFMGADITSIILPETLQEIQRYAFAQTELTAISIPDSVTFVGRYAFYGSKMQSVSIGKNSGLQTIEQYAFSGCRELKNIYLPASLTELGRYAFSQSGLESIDFSDSTLATIPEGAFMGSRLTSVALPDSLQLIDHNAFRDCENLAAVTFGKGELQLMSNVFYNSGLAEVYIPDNLTYIGEYSLVGLKNLTEFKVSATHPKYQAIDGLLYSKDGKKLICAPAGKTGEITLPKELEILGFGAFENSSLTKIHFHPDSNILTFGYRCFYNAALTEIDIPATVVSFDYYAFAMCENLTRVNIPADSQLKGIYEGAFYGCLNLQDFQLPESIAEISDYAFYGCRSLTKLPFSENAQVKGIYDYAFAFTTIQELNLPESLIDLGDYAFRGLEISSATVPDANAKQMHIGIGVFADCNQLEEITLPFIGASFEDDEIAWLGYIFGAGSYEVNHIYTPESLKTVTLTGDLRKIGTGAFNNLENLETVHLPDSITDIFTDAFYNTHFLYELKNPISCYYADEYGNAEIAESIFEGHIGAGIFGHVSLSDNMTSIGYRAFYGCSNLTGITIPDSVTSIGYDAFSGCTSLIDVTIPDAVISIKEGAFDGCRSLTSITIPDGVTSIESDTFEDCTSLTDVTIPDSVTQIGYYAFQGCTSLTSITIPDSVTSIDDHAFDGCTRLTNIIIPDSVTSIGNYTFRDCSSLTSIAIPDGVTEIGWNMFSGCISLSSITIPDSVTSIGPHAFQYCSSLSSITIPNSVTSIGEKAFYDCTGLTSITIPDGVTGIGNYTFYRCSSLSSITIGSSVSSIGNYAFYECYSLYTVINRSALEMTIGGTDYGYVASRARVIVNADGSKQYQQEDGYEYLETEDGFLFSHYYGEYKLISYFGNAKTITLPVNINGNPYSIYCLEGNFQNIIIPAGVTSIDNQAFWNCTNLISVTIPDTVTSIGERAFSGCTGLSSIIIPDSVTSIGNWAFSSCTGLTSITIPASVQSIGEETFYKCGIQQFDVDEESSYFSYQDGVLYDKEKTRIVYVLGSVSEIMIPATVTDLSGVFSGNTTITSVRFEEGSQITEIEDDAFCGCSSLTSVTIPDSVTSIGSSAFSGCTNLTEVTIPDGVTTIGQEAFYGCSSLTSITIPDSVTSIGASVFSGCTNLTSITIPDGVTSIGDHAFYRCSRLSSITIPDGVTSIGYAAFQFCSGLTSIHIGNGVTSIGGYAFAWCGDLKEVTISAGVQSLDGNIFFESEIQEIYLDETNPYLSFQDGVIYDKAKTKIVYVMDSVSEIVIPATVTDISGAFSGNTAITSVRFEEGSQITQIGSLAFYDCRNLTTVTLPDSVTSIGYYAFRSCTSLTSINIPTSMTSIGEGAFSYCGSLSEFLMPDGMTDIGDAAFESCIGLTSITIPDSVTSIGGFAFSGCTSLTSITIPDSVTSIGGFAFNDCVSLTSITIPDSVSSIAEGAFYSCNRLTSIAIPDGVTGIGYNTFYNCNDLISITLPDSLTSIGNSALSGCSSLTSITIPSGVTSIGSSAFANCTRLYEVINQSTLPLSFDSEDNTGLTNYARVLVNADGSKQYKDDENFTYIDTADGLRFAYYNGEYELIAYLGNAETITLPGDINGNPYTMNSLAGYIRNVIISEGVTSVGWAFRNCETLTSITIPGSVSYINGWAFEYCSNLASVTIGNGVTSIGMFAFDGCTSLTSIVIPDSVTEIGYAAFCNCTSLNRITVGSGVTSIGGDAFSRTAYYNDPDNWEHGCLYLGKHLLDIRADATFVTNKGGVTASNIFDQCYYLLSVEVGGKNQGLLRAASNLETLVLNELSSGFWIYEYFGSTTNVPLTLKTVVLRDGYNVRSREVFSGITGVTIYVEAEQDAVQWDHDMPGWNNGNKVYYGGQWICVEFYDDTGEIIDYGYYTVNQVIRQPYVANVVDGDTVKTFAGWDIDGDGIADAIPATSATHITAVALYETHRIGAAEVVQPTCTENGYRKTVCLDCGEVVEYRIIAKLGHTSGGYIRTEAPTCDQAGYELHKCSVCGDAYPMNFTPAAGHSYGDWVTDVAPTCTAYGSRYQICTVCGHREEEILPLASHNYQVQVLQEATCAEGGQLCYTCLDCGHSYAGSTDALAHSYEKCYTDSAFLQTLLELDADLVYGYEGARCYYYQCQDCGSILEQNVESAGSMASTASSACRHTAQGWTVVVEGSCAAAPVEARICSKCGQSVELRVNMAGKQHRYGQWTQTKAPTCTEDGEETSSCVACGESVARAIEKLGHAYDAVVNAPTCTEQGYTAHICSRCGDSYADAYVDALGHSYEQTAVTEPTCTQKGYTTYTCSHCGHSYADHYVDALGHNFVDEICQNCGRPEAEPGDVIGDGDGLNIMDVSAMLSVAMGYPMPEGFNEAAGDLDGDGLITTMDVFMALSIVLG